jgi:hypothetical protein
VAAFMISDLTIRNEEAFQTYRTRAAKAIAKFAGNTLPGKVRFGCWELLRDPYGPLRAAGELRQSVSWPVQYLRAAPEGAQPRVATDLKKLESCFEEQHAIPKRLTLGSLQRPTVTAP